MKPTTRRVSKTKNADGEKQTELRSRLKSVFEKCQELPSGHGVIYLGHLPHGFYEKEIYDYFQQFGKVVQVKVARSAKTGESRGYAFVEFADENVAKVAAQTMNNYLLFERLLKCHTVSFESGTEKYSHTFENSYRGGKLRELAIRARFARKTVAHIRAHNSKKTGRRTLRNAQRSKKSVKQLAERLSQHGVAFDSSTLLIGASKQKANEATGSKVAPAVTDSAASKKKQVQGNAADSVNDSGRKRIEPKKPNAAKKRKVTA